jgi:hypothetical protein
MKTIGHIAWCRWFPALPAIALAALLAGCATPTPYQKRNEGVGYHDFEVRPGVFFVSFTGSPGTSRGAVERYWHRRASEICGGPDRFEIIAKDPDGQTVLEPTANVLWPQSYPRVESLIQCRER